MSLRTTLRLTYALTRAHPASATPLRPAHAFLAPFLPRSPLATSANRSFASLLPRPPTPTSPPTQAHHSILQSLTRRPFTSSALSSIRNTYFQKGNRNGYGYGGGGGGGRGGGPEWFRNIKYRLDSIPTMRLVYGLIAANVGVFLLWQYALSSAQRFRDPSLLIFMRKNFILNEFNVMSGRIWTLITSAFSHSTGSHIFINCLGLYFMAPAAAGLMGSASFIGLYLGAGIFTSLTSLAWHRFSGHKWMGSEGASGAIYACLAYYGAIFPQQQVLMFFIIPMPVWVAIGGLFAYDLYGAILQPFSGTDSAGHIGGIVYGLMAALSYRRGGWRNILSGGRRRW
ncbi:hypothetical protein IAT38_000528 [Cryptococcus sp. DSM 104549]